MKTKCNKPDCWQPVQEGQAFCPEHFTGEVIRLAFAECKGNGAKRAIDGSRRIDHDDSRCIGCVEFIGHEIEGKRLSIIVGELCRKRGHVAKWHHPKCSDYKAREPMPEEAKRFSRDPIKEAEEYYAKAYEETDGLRVQADPR